MFFQQCQWSSSIFLVALAEQSNVFFSALLEEKFDFFSAAPVEQSDFFSGAGKAFFNSTSRTVRCFQWHQQSSGAVQSVFQ